MRMTTVRKGFAYNIIVIVLIVLIIGILIGYGFASFTPRMQHKPTKKVFTRTVFDVLGRKVIINGVPKRVVSLTPSITEILFKLGLGNRVVGVDRYSDYPPEVPKLIKEGVIKVIGGYWNPNLEEIVDLKPDLVIADLGADYKYLSKFEELNLNVLYVKGGKASSLNGIYHDILLIGEAFNVTNRAYELVSSIKSTVNQIRDTLIESNASSRKVLALLGPPTYGLWTGGSGTYINELIRICGGVNIASKYYGWIQISKEEVLSSNPDIIIVATMATKSDAKKIIEELTNPETGLNVTAVRDKNIYVLINDADSLLCRPGPRVVDAIKILSSIIHPEIFGALNRTDVVSLKQASLVMSLIGS